jgi:hypothetical protein
MVSLWFHKLLNIVRDVCSAMVLLYFVMTDDSIVQKKRKKKKKKKEEAEKRSKGIQLWALNEPRSLNNTAMAMFHVWVFKQYHES